jgi:nucleotide-binding universal stress UspA family protein
MKILIAVDGSPYTRAATRYIVRHKDSFSAPLEIHLLHVQPPIPYPRAAAVAGKAAVDKYQREESQAALAVAEKELTAAGIPFKSAWRVGEIAKVVESHARENGIDLVVMGSHGHGALAGLAMGSAATKLIASLTVPVLVVTREAALHANREQGKARRQGAQQGETVAGDD